MISLKNRLPSVDTLAIIQHANSSIQFESCARAAEFIDQGSIRKGVDYSGWQSGKAFDRPDCRSPRASVHAAAEIRKPDRWRV
ncbi:MAG: hypothetical protein AAB150_12135 [Pseudomonadota bacterium]